jgi:hypothetical protein
MIMRTFPSCIECYTSETHRTTDKVIDVEVGDKNPLKGPTERQGNRCSIPPSLLHPPIPADREISIQNALRNTKKMFSCDDWAIPSAKLPMSS